MIKEKTIYCSTKTGKEYVSLVEAVLEDTAADNNADDVKDLLQKFRSVRGEFYREIRSAKEISEKELSERVAEIHSRYDDILNQLAEQLSKRGVKLSDDSQNVDGKTPKRHPRRHIKVVKARTIINPNRFLAKSFL